MKRFVFHTYKFVYICSCYCRVLLDIVAIVKQTNKPVIKRSHFSLYINVYVNYFIVLFDFGCRMNNIDFISGVFPFSNLDKGI